MVHRPIFLGVAMGVKPQRPSLNLSITINDGFFVLGTKNYCFPIVDKEEEIPPSPNNSPQLTQEVPGNDQEMQELLGMYIDLKKKIRMAPCLTAALNGQSEAPDTKSTESTRIASKSPPTIDLEEACNLCRMPSDIVVLESFSEEVAEVLNHVLLVTIDKWLSEYTKGNAVKIVGVALSVGVLHRSKFADEMKSMLWNKYDILPCFFSGGCKPLDQQSEALARKCASLFRHENLPDLTIAESNRVVVDSGHIWFCSLEEYRKSIGARGSEFMGDLIQEAQAILEAQQKVAFFSSTAQGGGVALMRHSLIRFLQMLGIDASWYVCTPSPSVFNITKMKVHNILQNAFGKCLKTQQQMESELPGSPSYDENGECSRSDFLTQRDKNKIDAWLKVNYESHWRNVIKACSIVVLDDHQVGRLAQVIKKEFPSVKIIYRSHIQIRGEMIQEGKGENITAIDNVWNFLWESIQNADYFVSHPFPEAVPKSVSPEKVVFQPAGTDQLDGLNKPLSRHALTYYQNVFSRICLDNGENPVDFSRKYIVQVARFDPSKGINDLLDAYYKLYCMHKEQFPEAEFDVGLVLCGHGSVDDPEATTIFQSLSEKVNDEKFLCIKHKITKVRLPPSDQLLNMILQGAHVTCQLSISEGFEVKVTESLMKKVPVVVYDVGGLPLQVKNNVNGHVVEKGNTKRVAEVLFKLITDNVYYKSMQDNIHAEDFLVITTPFQALFWLKMFNPSTPKKPKNYYEDFAEKYLK
ncbi:alpha,alpha-trehalose phosphorylase (configuration-retaining) [Nematocida major]|uniref:alpha,alpha-trehalose phosphorylase (configuration-retaining) n=1 Tax=Nematocida major TaxID=1912982 RepID=UPI0020086BA8|nr:alpha,alpha-trehalose phosphorylase (configuration-retaining) [Nematocida major]KAH9385586.1 alpha,alpha-trehalose phosphorylase (configuration-retaining) [Nematocida major]